MQTHCYELPIRVLIYRDGRDFVAHALELDLVAYEKSEKAAMEELHETMQAQMSYASQMNQPELVCHPAPREFFNRWEKAQQAAIRGSMSKDKPAKMETKAIFVTFTEQEIRAAKGATFERAADADLAKTA